LIIQNREGFARKVFGKQKKPQFLRRRTKAGALKIYFFCLPDAKVETEPGINGLRSNDYGPVNHYRGRCDIVNRMAKVNRTADNNRSMIPYNGSTRSWSEISMAMMPVSEGR